MSNSAVWQFSINSRLSRGNQVTEHQESRTPCPGALPGFDVFLGAHCPASAECVPPSVTQQQAGASRRPRGEPAHPSAAAAGVNAAAHRWGHHCHTTVTCGTSPAVGGTGSPAAAQTARSPPASPWLPWQAESRKYFPKPTLVISKRSFCLCCRWWNIPENLSEIYRK